MSRMDRYKKIHEETSKKESLFARKQIINNDETGKSAHHKIDDYQEDRAATESPYKKRNKKSLPRFDITKRNNSQTNHNGRNNKEYGNSAEPKNTKTIHQVKSQKTKKPKKKHPVIRFIIGLLLFLLIYSGVAFAMGKMAASSDREISKQEAETFNGFTAADGANNILLLGSDSRKGETARADTIMVLQLDGPSKKPKLISFMRDTLVDIPGVGQNKINASYAYGGADLVRQTLSQNFGLECKYYAVVDFKSFEKVIDTLFPGGVAINAEKDMSTNLEVPIKKGQQDMDGLHLLQYARFRMDEEGDFGRVRRQQQVMNAIFSQMKSPLAIAKLPYAAGKVLGYTGTDLKTSFLVKNSFRILKGAGGIDRLTVPAKDTWEYGTTAEAGSVLVIDKAANKTAINNFLAK
ncbi:transcriptional regulator [Enterococcus saigonensis]|uniref:Regulatory protein MsrR n=1 Tax=Enterococcus saigonensis TaxID=1805431 RepID=A0A679IJP1_9ENTE|nr:LCP family protein [Enterococcus saigonensis]BCA85725.1 transcriptional regulator [Enterococcus saigonensis]